MFKKKKKAKKTKDGIELNAEFKRALDLLENTNENLFITGRAGTGKSTLLTYFREKTKKKAVVLAPTGVAAVNIKGQTVHSFFGFKPGVTLQKVRKIGKKNAKSAAMYKKLDTIIIDEISMVRADLLDCIDKFMRLNGRDKDRPFGGVQMVFIGDLYQLPPVLTSEEKGAFLQQYSSPYFFASRVFTEQQQQRLISSRAAFSLRFIELEKIYRQREGQFINLLNAIRNDTITQAQIQDLNQHLDPDYEPKKKRFEIFLTTTNKMAATINEKELAKLKGKPRTFKGANSGQFEEKAFPTDAHLEVKVGAQVMLLNNDRQGRWINGTIGKVVAMKTEEKDKEVVMVELPGGSVETVRPHTWDMYSYTYDDKKNRIESDVVGSFTQFPFKLAWAVTIHKAQGKTFDRVILDIGNGTFAPGQLYVALSRCTSLKGLVLKKPIRKRHVWMDNGVVDFVTRLQYRIAADDMPIAEKVALIEAAIEAEKQLVIMYLRRNGEKSRRVISPRAVEERAFRGEPYMAVSAYCHEAEEEKLFCAEQMLVVETCDT